MNRDDLKMLAQMRLLDAQVLRRQGHYSAAYYLCGYAVECALKACIAKQIRRHEFPDRKLANDSYTHDLERLVRLAGLRIALETENVSDPALAVNWSIAKDWSEESRYAMHTPQEAADLYVAVADRRHGVLRWIRQHW